MNFVKRERSKSIIGQGQTTTSKSFWSLKPWGFRKAILLQGKAPWGKEYENSLQYKMG